MTTAPRSSARWTKRFVYNEKRTLGLCPKPHQEPEVLGFPAFCVAHARRIEGSLRDIIPQAGLGGSPTLPRRYRLTLCVYPLALPKYSTPLAIDAASNEPFAIVVAFSPFTSQVITPLPVSSMTFCP